MSGTYSEKLRDPRWQKKRLEIMGRDSFKCRLCGDRESTLHVHHLHYRKNAEPWDYYDSSLVTLCESCHSELHAVKFGENILEAIIVGGAGLSDIYGVLYAFELTLNPESGPHGKPIPAERWGAVETLVSCGLSAIQNGATNQQIAAALQAITKR